jgi:hypothetical protein
MWGRGGPGTGLDAPPSLPRTRLVWQVSPLLRKLVAADLVSLKSLWFRNEQYNNIRPGQSCSEPELNVPTTKLGGSQGTPPPGMSQPVSFQSYVLNSNRSLFQCSHKGSIGCILSTAPNCCACSDQRPNAPAYPVYVDGEGIRYQGTRWGMYCWKCRG